MINNKNPIKSSSTGFRVLFDAHMLGEQEGGNETYAAGLVSGFSNLETSPSFQFTTLYGPHYHPNSNGNNQISFVRLNPESSWKRVFGTIPQLCRKLKADIVHVTYNASPFLTCPSIVSVHDVIYRLYPQYFSPRVRLLLSTLLPLSMIKAKKIITISQTSKKDIETFYPFTRGKVVVVPIAAGPIVEAVPDYQGSYSLIAEEFILSVGTLQPRKNILRLIDAYLEAREQGLVSAKLLIVGRAAWQHSQMVQKAIQSAYGQDIIFAGYLSNELLSALYRRCKLFVYPSLYEGFGLPVLEAMVCNAPVVTSNCSSMPEVAGDSAMLIDPESVSSIRDALVQILNDEQLRQDLCNRGMANARRFSWEKTAAMTLDTYKQTVSYI